MPRVLAYLPFLMAPLAFAASGPAPAAPLLPQSFAGWTAVMAKDVPAAPGPAEAVVLKEDGLSRSGSALYRSGSSDAMIRAWEFSDATGAYSAFTYYRQPQMHAESIGSEAAAAGDHFVFWTGATVVDATFAHPAKDETGMLTALAAALPKVHGGEGVPPSLPHYLPPAGLGAETVKYAIGPAAYAAMGGALPANAVDFSQDAEAVTAQYGVQGAQGTLTIVMYPTPQMAEAHRKTLETAAQSGHGIGGVARRIGPLLAVVDGNLPAQNANALLDAIHISDTVTINHPEGYVPETVKMYRLLFGITMLTVILVCAAVFLGLFLGGGRAMVRVMRGKPVSSVSEEEFISLHLGS